VSRLALLELVDRLRASPGIAHKGDIAAAVATLELTDPAQRIPVGDDCAALPDGDGYLLFAIEGFINAFVERDPWFAGWCGVMVNVSDIYAMGGRPTAVVNAIWSADAASMRPVLAGLAAAARAYGVPVVGGHSNARSIGGQLSVAILGRSGPRLLTSFDAQPGDVLVAAIDLRGGYRAPYRHFNASTEAPPAQLRGDLEVLPRLAEDGLCRAAKDISQAGVIGTTLMLLECSGVGATLDVNAVPAPYGVDRADWLVGTFPSFGFVLAVPPQHLAAVLQRFRSRAIACAAVGECDDSRCLRLRYQAEVCLAWDFGEQALIGCGPTGHALEPAHA
jgi:uncharacterized protein